MSIPTYVTPEQLMLDRAEFARKGIARGRSVAACKLESGILFVAENHSTTLHKISEIYDRICFAAVGRYHEFEMLRVAGIQHADMRGYAYDRLDVTARSLVGAYSQILGTVFASSVEKPYEVELIVAELGEQPSSDVLYRISHDGVISDEPQVTVIGGDADRIHETLRDALSEQLTISAALRLVASALHPAGDLRPEHLEVGLLNRSSRRRRCFQRLSSEMVAEAFYE